MATAQSIEHIEATPGVLGGKPRIKGRRIAVVHIKLQHLNAGMSVDEICREYDLQPAEVYAALAYYYDHRVEIDRRQAEDDAFVEEFFRDQLSIEQKYGTKDRPS